MPIVPGTTEPVDDRRGRGEDRRGDRLPDRGQGRGRRRRQGLPRRARAGQARRRVRGRRARGREVLLRRDRLPRALPARPAPRRGPGARRRARQRDPPRRARLLDPAPPPEADRGVAGAARRRGAARADRPDRDRGGARGRLPRRGDDRGPAAGRRVLLPRDEHARPGRALRDRGDDRASTSCASRSGSRPASRCRSPRTRSCCAATRSSAGSTPRTPRRTSRPRPGTVTRYREPSGPGVRVDSGVLAGSEITPLYDPMVAKLIVWDVDREAATRRMARALEEFEIEGVQDADPVPQGDHGLGAVGEGARRAAT